MSEAVATTTETTAQGSTGDKYVVQGGDASLLFDELQNHLATESGATKHEKSLKSKDTKESKEVKKETEKAEKKDLSTNDSSSGKKEAKDSKEDKKEKLEKSEDKKEEIQRKKFKAKWEDQELELDEDSEFEHPVNGQPTKIKLKELLSDYSGRTNWNKQFQDLSVSRKENDKIKADLAAANEKFKSIFEEKDPQLRLFKMAEQSGVSPVEFRQKFLDDNIKLLEKWSTMSDDERKADALSFENNYLKHQMDTKAKAEAQSQAQKQLQAKVETLLTSHKLTADEFDAQDQYLEKLFTEQKIDLKQITPELVVETLIKDKLWAAAQPAIEKAKVQLDRAQIADLINKAYIHKLDPADMDQVVDQLYGTGKAKQVVEEKRKQAEEFKQGVKPKATRPAQNDPDTWSFDQIL